MRKLFLILCFFTLFSSTIASAVQGSSNLTFEQRVACYKAVEEVYWQHTIWPSENPGPKPELKAVMPDSIIREKTGEYIRVSNALDSNRDRRITPKRLQAEMNRMASETQNPELLQELWTALKNDPYWIAECFARPALAERSIRKNEKNLRSQQFRSDTITNSASYSYTLPQIKGDLRTSASGVSAVQANAWTALPTLGAPAASSFHSAVWTGTYMIIWGGYSLRNDGKKYNPATNSWSAISSTGAPSGRYSHTAIWTGTEMIIWGGRISTGYTNSGGRFTLSTNSWSATTATSAPTVRANHTAIWNGTHMIVWGGSNGTVQRTGGRYNPSANSWSATSTTGAPTARYIHSVALPTTNNQMIIWGGAGSSNTPTSSGGRYLFGSNTWVSTNTGGAPSARYGHSAVWTGHMIVWGGRGTLSNNTNTGGRFTVGTNSWTSISAIGAPSARFRHSAVWTGTQMIIWGGMTGTLALNTGARYLPASDTWISMATTGQPSPRYAHTAIWTGSKMIVWGGNTSQSTVVSTNTGGIYTP